MNILHLISAGIILCSIQNHRKKAEASRVNEIAKPNILFLFADDQRANAQGCSGNIYIRTESAHSGNGKLHETIPRIYNANTFKLNSATIHR
jgi:hypothetical protein